MKIMKSEVSFKSDVALVVVGQDANSEGFTGRLTVVPGCFNCRAALILYPGWGSCSKANRVSSFYLGQLISCRLLAILKNQML